MAIFDTRPYRTYDVLIMEPNEIESGEVTHNRLFEEHDNRVSLPRIIDTAKEGFPVQKFLWYLDGRGAKIDFYRFLYRVRGRQKMMWVPTWKQDLILTASTPEKGRTLTVKNIGLSRGGYSERRSHIMIKLDDGRKFYRRINDTEFVSNEEENITIHEGIFTGLDPTKVDMICFMGLARLDNDTIEIRHHTDMDGIATCATVFKTIWDIRNV